MKSFLSYSLIAVLGFALGLVTPQPQFVQKHLPRVSLSSDYEEKGKAVLAHFAQDVDPNRVLTDLVGTKLYVRYKGDWTVTKSVKVVEVLDSTYLYDYKVRVDVRITDSFEENGKKYTFSGLVRVDYDAVYNNNTHKLVWFTEGSHVLSGDATFPPEHQTQTRRGLFRR